ncbi:MAG: hypothetical protein GY711_30175 [bacterium]|nr:hypothetical protein [bacterium]
MKMRSQRGAARISAIWMIVVVVLFFAALGYAYIANEDKVKAESERGTAVAAADAMEVERDAAREDLLTITKPLGFYDRVTLGKTSDAAQAAEGLAQLRATFPDLGEDIEDFERAIPVLVSSYSTQLSKISTLDQRITDLEAEVNTAKAATTDVASTKDVEIEKVQQALADALNTSRDEKAALETTVQERTDSRNQVDGELRTERGVTDTLRRETELAAQASQTRFANLTKQLEFMKEREKPDGAILSVSKQLGLSWINRGSGDRITRGMRFLVTSGNPAAPREKGEIEVVNVKAAMSEVRVTMLRDQFDPIVAGDLISNPLYDPEAKRNAVLVGRFSGIYNEAELKVLLADIGITVQDKVDLDTTYLIVGSELYVDADGEPVEEAIQPSETAAYKDAAQIGANVVSINDIQHFFRK